MREEKVLKIAKFIRRLYKIVSDDNFPEIQWTADGQRFHILNKNEFMKNGLKFISKTTEFSAFVRLLYVYGFSKSKSINANEEEYFHRNFQRNGEQMLPCIKRSVETKSTMLANNTNKTPNQLQDLLQYLNTQNFKLENEVRILRERVDKQDCTINGLVEILSRLFTNNDGNTTYNNNRELDIYLQNNPSNGNQVNSLQFIPEPQPKESQIPTNRNVLFDSDEDSFYETEYF